MLIDAEITGQNRNPRRRPIHAPKILVFGGLKPLNVIGHYRDPQKAHSSPKPHLHANFGEDRSTGATWARAEEIKKKEKKARKEIFLAPFSH